VQVRRIKHLRVFFITATWSVFAYLWLYIIIAVTSPEIVELWEAILTFFFFPATVLTAYIADRYAQSSCLVPRRIVQCGGSVTEWLACWTQAQKRLGSNRSRDAVGYQS